MGCLNSKGLSVNEPNKNIKHEQDNTSNKNRTATKGKNNINKFIIENSILERNKDIEENKFEYRYEINLIYAAESKDTFQIFGEDFIKRNENNIELVINGEPNKPVTKCELEEGENNITLKIKKTLTNISFMFDKCKNLKDISDLKYLDIREAKSFEAMFHDCILLTDITALQNWNISKVNNLRGMFCGCSSLIDITPLKNWNFSDAIDLNGMFGGCISLTDIKPLKDWNVSNASDFGSLFIGCVLLSDITPLKNWNILNARNLEGMFSYCSSLTDITPLKDWNVSNVSDFGNMFRECSSLSNLMPLLNWKPVNGKNFDHMFYGCKLSGHEDFEDWNLPRDQLGNIFF